MKPTKKLFLSYAGDDQGLCKRLWSDLGAATKNDAEFEIVLWSMDKNIIAGDKFDPSIKAALEESDLGVFAVSYAMLTSPYIQDTELSHFLTLDKPIVPLLLHELSQFTDLKGLAPHQMFGWENPYENATRREARRRWATKLSETIHLRLSSPVPQ